MKKTTPPKEAQDDEEKEKEKRNWKEERKKAGEGGERAVQIHGAREIVRYRCRKTGDRGWRKNREKEREKKWLVLVSLERGRECGGYLLWNLYLQSSAATMSSSRMYFAFGSSPDTLNFT